MQLTIYLMCDEAQLDPSREESVRMQWVDGSPAVGERIRMGGDGPLGLVVEHRSFEVVHIYRFEPAEAAPVAAVYLALVALPGSSIPQERWSCWRYGRQESFFVHLEAVGLPPLSYGINGIHQPPEVGEALLAGVPMEGDTARLTLVPQPWSVHRVVTYLPVGEGPYPAVYLSWCKGVSKSLAGPYTKAEQVISRT